MFYWVFIALVLLGWSAWFEYEVTAINKAIAKGESEEKIRIIVKELEDLRKSDRMTVVHSSP